MTNHSPTIPLACSLERDDLADRLARWQALRASAGIETTRTERGLRVIFRRESGVAEELEALVALERDCCAFADWAVEIDGARIVLEVSGDTERAIAAVQGVFAAFRRPRAECGC